MSAQAGLWNFNGQSADSTILGKLGSAIEPFGPDGGKTFIDGSLGMVYCAFHTTRESRLEKQPYVSTRGTVCTWDGRLDNREDLIDQLDAELTADHTDVAIVTAAFDRWGTDSFHRIIGDWSLSIWQPRERELLLTCDYMSIRHIFYLPKSERIWWSTDLTPLVALSGEKLHIDDAYVGGYFANDPDSHLTPYREIHQVPAGHFVRVRKGHASVQRYWQFSPKSRIRYRTDGEYEEHFCQVFRQAVSRRLRSDSPVLAELSGGIDSSSIVCMADDIIAKDKLQPVRLDTLSYCDPTEPSGDDSIYFPKIEEKRGRAGIHIDASKYGDGAPLECPDFSVLPGSLGAGRAIEEARAAAVRNGGYRAVLSGTGGDEFMGGVPNPYAQLADLIAQFKLLTLARQLVAWSLVKRRPLLHLLWETLAEFVPPSLAQHFDKQGEIAPWIENRFARRTKIAIKQLDVDEHFGLWLPTRRSYIAGVLSIANQMSKRLPSKTALEETRYPYLDRNLIEFVLSIPATQLLRPGERRSLMRRSLRGIVPSEILSRRTKQIAARTPVIALKKNLSELKSFFETPVSSSLGYVNRDRFMERVHAAIVGSEVHIVRILKTISLEIWLRDVARRHLISVAVEAARPAKSTALEASA